MPLKQFLFPVKVEKKFEKYWKVSDFIQILQILTILTNLIQIIQNPLVLRTSPREWRGLAFHQGPGLRGRDTCPKLSEVQQSSPFGMKKIGSKDVSGIKDVSY